MKRICLALDLKDDPELIAQYETYHTKERVWPEIISGIRACGIVRMDIYRVETRLMMLLETEDDFDLSAGFGQMRQMPRQKEWAALMGQFQERLPFAKAGEHWVEMKQIFQLY